MRLVFDLFPCQTDSRLRGIGRYTHSLVEGLIRLRGEHEVRALANHLYADATEELRQEFSASLPQGHFSSYTHPRRASFNGDQRAYQSVATALIHHAYQAVSPDVVITTPFEGWGEEGIAPLPCGSAPAALRVAVIYDFIPWLFPAHYLDPVLGYKEWYMQRMAALNQFDLLLAISEATRRDAIELLGIAPERVVNISGAASPKFCPMPKNVQDAMNIARFGISRPFVLYTGNADYRKNQDGMLKAYALLPESVKKSHQLVLNQVGDKEAFWRKAHALGLKDNDVIVTGHISDNELICLYTQCTLFVFPSLYEGFGLPMLEAMACGAPVIAANNSSIPEVVGRSDILFDASRPEAIALEMNKILQDEVLRENLVRYSLERANYFSWDRTADLAWRAIEACLAEKQSVAIQRCTTFAPKSRIAVFLSTHAEVVANCEQTLSLLTRYFEIDLFIEEDTVIESGLLQAAFPMYSHTQFDMRHDRYASVVFHIANDLRHAFMLPLLEKWSGIVVLHDLHLDAIFKALSTQQHLMHLFVNEIMYSDGVQGLLAYVKNPHEAQRLWAYRRLLESSHQLILANERHVAELAQACKGEWQAPTPLHLTQDVDQNIAAYVQAILSASNNSDHHTITQLADALEHYENSSNLAQEIAIHAVSNWRLRKQSRILIDVTQLARMDLLSGIQRVVKNIAKELCGLPELSRPIELVRMVDGKLLRATNVIGAIFGVSPDDIPHQHIDIHPGDTLLMIDSSWEQYAEFIPTFQLVRQLGGKIVTVVYDLIPLRMPQMCLSGLVTVFKNWFNLAVMESDMLLCISRSIAEDVDAYLHEQHLNSTRKLAIQHWPLGADIVISTKESTVRRQVNQIAVFKDSPLFLCVGTIEPRKGHEFILDAFELLWQNGVDVRLCIAGQEGWHVEETMARIRNHAQLNKRLYLVEKFTDAEINLCYANATALIAASVAEGYGLPIVEAALHKLPVLASDIPVFREVGGDGACYFSLESPQNLADAVNAFCVVSDQDRQRMASKIKTFTWQESARTLLEKIGG